MPARHRPLQGTPLAIIEAAERLFGENGIESVSLRQIRIEACAGNNSAISYHFSDRAKLVQAIWEHRLPELDRARQKMLDELMATGLETDPISVMRALMMPNYELTDENGFHRYTAFFRHALRWQQGATIRSSQLHITPASRTALKLFHALRPDTDIELMNYRLRHNSCMFFDMVFERDCAVNDGGTVTEESEFLAEALEMISAACLR